METIKWNFEKFLINRDGQVHARYTSIAGGSHLEPEIQKLLAEQPTQQAPAAAE
jgi:glutathione peroxidase